MFKQDKVKVSYPNIFHILDDVYKDPDEWSDFIDGPYWAKMLILCLYTVWVVMPFKILILTSALASVNQNYYDAARVDGTTRWRMFTRITLPMISPTVFYLIITGFIGAFKAYSDSVALYISRARSGRLWASSMRNAYLCPSLWGMPSLKYRRRNTLGENT